MASRTSPRKVAAVVLAAGLGKRMKSARPKVLHEVCGRPSLWYVLKAALGARPSSLAVVVGPGREQVEDAVRSWGLRPAARFLDQGEPLGTGHAVMTAEQATVAADDVLVLPGDDPLVTGEDVRKVLAAHRRTGAAATIATTVLSDPTGYGRVIRDGDRLVRIAVEDLADASQELRKVREVSTLVYAFRREDLFGALPLLSRDNRQREYYLPDVVAILVEKGERVSAVPVDWGATMGLNSRAGLAAVTRVMRARIVERHMANGVTFVDPNTAFVDAGVRIGPDAVIFPFTFLEGRTRIGPRARIGPATRVVDSGVGEESEVSFSVVRQSRIGPRVAVGPYASLRPGTVLEEGAKAGTFVEVKASKIGKGSKVPHLSYVGDALLGDDVNIGAGTITANYDGFEKHRTVIGDRARIGSDTMLIAPVRVGKRAWTAAGSAITKNVPAGALAVERADQKTVPGYDERKREEHGERAKGKERSRGSNKRAKASRRGGRNRG